MSAAAGIAPSSTPTVRQTARRGLFWAVAGVGVVLVAVVVLLIQGTGGVGGTPLAADNPGIAGGQAVARVLEQQGVEVIAVDTLDAARSAAGPDTTLFFSDPQGILDDAGLRTMAGLAGTTVVADPGFTALDAIAPEVGAGGSPGTGPLPADCSVPAAERAGSISGGAASLVTDDSAWTGCFPGAADGYGLLQRAEGTGTLTLVADGALFRNDTVERDGNAAVALGLLGGEPTLVWYQPSLADVPASGQQPSLADLTPGWVTPVAVLLAVVAGAAAVWRGRRFGPLVIEDLPVTVPASETMEGRARLYARTGARLRAVDALRIGAIGRLSTHLGLPRTATVDEVAVAASAASGMPAAEVLDLLLSPDVATDRAMMTLSSRLTALEHAAGVPDTAIRHLRPVRESTGRMNP